MKTAVVLFNLGGPDKQESVKPFLFNLFNDPNIFRLPNPFRYLLARFISSRRTKEATESLARLGHALKQIPDTIHWTPPTDEQVQNIVDEAKQTGRFGVL